jgi:hypothetical protein
MSCKPIHLLATSPHFSEPAVESFELFNRLAMGL